MITQSELDYIKQVAIDCYCVNCKGRTIFKAHVDVMLKQYVPRLIKEIEELHKKEKKI